jgi:hypothetical protein
VWGTDKYLLKPTQVPSGNMCTKGEKSKSTFFEGTGEEWDGKER